ncbi:MAG TPA: septum formation initiator family protein [Pyrinomonadaceae bacterium]|nr:septum formation initiator family protein [Pyrinomonadaceae bacterium]
MNKAANTYWTDTRLAAQRPTGRALALPSPVGETARATAAPRELTRPRRSYPLPSWVVFCTIMLATFALCATVTMRTHAEMRGAEQKFERMNTDVEQLRNTNEALRQEVERLRTDPRAVEAAARARLNMVRANEIVVPVE